MPADKRVLVFLPDQKLEVLMWPSSSYQFTTVSHNSSKLVPQDSRLERENEGKWGTQRLIGSKKASLNVKKSDISHLVSLIWRTCVDELVGVQAKETRKKLKTQEEGSSSCRSSSSPSLGPSPVLLFLKEETNKNTVRERKQSVWAVLSRILTLENHTES